MLATGLHAANFKGLPNVNCRFTGSTLQGFFGVVFGFFCVVFCFVFFFGGWGQVQECNLDQSVLGTE